MAGRNEINMNNVTFGNNQTTNINYGNELGDHRRIVFLDAVQRQDIIKIKQYFIAHPDIFDSEFKVKTFMFACELNKMSAKNILWQNWKNELLPLLLHNFEQCQDDLLSTKDIMKTSDAVQRYILLNYITRGNEEVFRKAVMSGANPYLPAEDGQLLINKARSKGFKDLVEYKNLWETVRAGNLIMTHAMLLRGDDINQKADKCNTPLHVAFYNRHFEIMSLLLDHVLDVNEWDGIKNTLLHLATDKGIIEAAKMLVQHRADVNDKNNHGNTPLHKAAGWGYIEIVKILLQADALVNCKDNCGDTPLHKASRWGHIVTVQILLEAGANINCKNEYDTTPLHYAARQDHVEIVQNLLQAGAAVNSKDNCGQIPLHEAVRRGRIEIFQSLLKAGADVNTVNDDGATPLDRAILYEREAIIQLLKGYGAVEGAIEENCVIQ